ncbi:hypothetical protein WDZ92_18395, partial [Nostoc sp. NIES-2111]
MGLVFGFHGGGGKGEDALNMGVRDAATLDANAIFVAPDGVKYKSYGIGWDDTCGGYDIPFFDNIVADMSNDYCI